MVNRLALAGVVLQALGMTTSAWGQTFLVNGASGACSDAGPGTEAIPYCTISAAMAAHNGPGVTIVVKPAVYRETVTVPTSGAPGNPFVLQADGPGVVLDGTEYYGVPFQWIESSPDVWFAASVNWFPMFVLVDGEFLTPAPVTPPVDLPPGSFRYVQGSGLYVNIGGDSPGVHDTRVARYDGITVSGRNWITVDGFEIVRPSSFGVRIGGATNVRAAHNTITLAGSFGIYVSNSSNLTLASNVVSKSQSHGIAFRTISDSVIEDNVVFQNNGKGINCIDDTAPSVGNRFQRNRLYENSGTGLNFERSSDNLSIQNIAWANGDHGFFHSITTGTRHIGDVAWGNADDGFAFKDGSTGSMLANCIAVDNGLGESVYGLNVDSTSAAGFVSDDNIIWYSNSQAPVRNGDAVYPTVAAFSSATGHDTRSIQSDPLFLNPPSGDFHVAPGSPAIDSGNSGVADWPATDADGAARIDDPATSNTGLGPIDYADRGAFEFQPGGPLDVTGASFSSVVLTAMSPNPMRGIGRFGFALPSEAPVRVTIHDVQGRMVATLAHGRHAAGRHEASWNGRADRGIAKPGLYFLRLETSGQNLTRKFLVVQ